MTETLIHGECLEQMALLPDASIDAIITDPPYGTTACRWDSVIPFEPMWEQLKRIIKPRGAIVLFGSQPFTSALIMSNVEWFKYCWVWEKNIGSNFASTKYHPMKEHEDISLFSKEAHNYYPIMQPRTISGDSRSKYKHYEKGNKRAFMRGEIGISKKDKSPLLRVPSSVQKFNRETGEHPNQKPIKLMEYLVKTYTLEGQTVLDFTMGSGSTGVACKNTGRNFIGIEQDESYFEIAQKRIAAAVRQLELGL
jgi:site-specific DNA-methyltransferase (adenine-specific)